MSKLFRHSCRLEYLKRWLCWRTRSVVIYILIRRRWKKPFAMMRNSKWTVLQSRLGVITNRAKKPNMETGSDDHHDPHESNGSSPIETFQWCLHFLRTIFQLIGQDIFHEHYRYGFAFYFIIFSAIVTNVCYFSTVNDEHYDSAVRFNCAAMIFGITQVRPSVDDGMCCIVAIVGTCLLQNKCFIWRTALQCSISAGCGSKWILCY